MKKPFFITVIQDSNDSGTKGRITTRIQKLFEGILPSFVSVEAFSDLPAAGNLLDILDSSEGSEGVIILNTAPRHGEGKKYKNGIPFGYFYYKKTLVVTTINKSILSFVKKFNITNKVNIFDIEEVMKFALENNLIEDWVAEKVINTQFRSFEFEPRAAFWLWNNYNLPFNEFYINEEEYNFEEEKGKIWLIDNFGNCKTTLLANDFQKGELIKTKIGNLKVYDHLSDLPNGEAGLVKGSSGLNKEKFIEVIIQGKRASDEFGLKIGEKII